MIPENDAKIFPKTGNFKSEHKVNTKEKGISTVANMNASFRNILLTNMIAA